MKIRSSWMKHAQYPKRSDVFPPRETQGVLHALGDVLAAGGDVVVRFGNHDIELAPSAVQAAFPHGP